MTSTRSQNYTIMMVGEHGIQAKFKLVVVVLLLSLLSFDVFVPKSAHPLLFWASGLSKNTSISLSRLMCAIYCFTLIK